MPNHYPLKSNYSLKNSNLTRHKEISLEVIDIQVDCVQEIYNIGIENLGIDLTEEASKAFENLHTQLY